MKVTEAQGPQVKVGSIASENAGSLKESQAHNWSMTGAGRYSVDDKGTRDERSGMSGRKGEEDELTLAYCFCGEREAKLAAWGSGVRTVLTQFPTFVEGTPDRVYHSSHTGSFDSGQNGTSTTSHWAIHG